MKEVFINPDNAQVVEIHESGSVCVHFPGTDAAGNPRKWKSSEEQECDIDEIIEGMVMLRGHEIEDETNADA
jgi:hypothetical protein